MQRATGTMKTILFRLFVASLIVHDTYVCAFLWIEPQCSGRVSALSVALGSANRIVSPSSLLLSIHDAPSTNTATSTAETHASILQTIESIKDEANEYAESFGLGPSEAAFYGLFLSIRRLRIPLGLHGHPFLLRHTEIETALHQPSRWPGFFTLGDLEKALSDDFLDAARGSTDNRKGWQITDVSVPRGESFEEARMTFSDVQLALEKGTIILNAAGAHIPRLAGPTLAATDAMALPCALNLYVTAAGKRTSAPPHTDKQDVCVVQTEGKKAWKVFSPPDPSMKASSDIFSRGKGLDSLPLHSISETCHLLLETTLSPGDVLFIPAGFPHTTSTVLFADKNESPLEETSVHLTLGIDHHIWELDYLSVRRLAHRRAHLLDDLVTDDSNPFVGKVNQLPLSILADLMAELPLGLLGEDGGAMLEEVVVRSTEIAKQIDPLCQVDTATWQDTVGEIRRQGMELLDIHRDMYLAALEEGRIRDAEVAMSPHLEKKIMTPDRVQRLSCFRVKRFYDLINDSKQLLAKWSLAGTKSDSTPNGDVVTELPSDWPFSLSVSVGDKVEADLGGAFFPASVTRVSNGCYDVAFFDGDRETGLSRNQIKLLAPSAQIQQMSRVDTSTMTAKQLKRWKQEQGR